jgi:PAS domain S-box-containing protein
MDEFLARLPEQNPAPVMRLSKDGKILYANNAAKTLLNTIDFTAAARLAVKSLAEGLPANVEVQCCPDRWFDLVLVPVPAESCVNIYGVDITDRKRVEDALKYTEAQYRSLTENSPDLIARFDQQLRHLFVNPAAAKAGSYSPDEYVDKTIREVGVPDQEARKWEERIKKAFATGQIVDVEDVFETPQGKQYFSTKFVPERATDGTIISVQSVARDITERKRLEAELREKMNEYKLISDAAVGRELKMIELEQEVNGLLRELGRPPHYK